uniref:Lectizyme n=1 Tax=Glossina austeni TaxID=7395 RepID=A0A1A9UQB5_GLOAU
MKLRMKTFVFCLLLIAALSDPSSQQLVDSEKLHNRIALDSAVTYPSVLSQKSAENEAEQLQSRIVSGTPAVSGQLPWQVLLKRDEFDDLLCGGSIMNECWVLTAAHCTHPFSSIFIMFGTVLIDDFSAVNMIATEFHEHPNYDPDTLHNDVSLIRLPKILNYSSNIKPIPLVTSAYAGSSFIGHVGVVAGFGLTDDEYLDYSKVLLWAQVEIIDNSQCMRVYGDNVVIDSVMCARGRGNSNQGICTGDSGGPLLARGNNNQIIQIGINSFIAEDRCTEGLPSGFVRLTSFLTFIANTTGMKIK